MKKIYSILTVIGILVSSMASADSFTISTSGISYSPSSLTVNVGDEITIMASASHPLVQVDESTWNANGSAQLSGGFGPETSAYTFTVTSTETIYFVCSVHASAGMKGVIMVSSATGISDLNAAADLRVFPNPVVNGDFTVKGFGAFEGAELELYNVSGQLIKRMPLVGESMEVHAEVASGVYSAVVVKNNKALLRKRLVFLSE